MSSSVCLPMAGDREKHLFPPPLLNTLDSFSRGFFLFVCPTRQNLRDVVDALPQEIVRSWVGQDRKCIMGWPFWRDVGRVGRDKSKRKRKETWWSAVFFLTRTCADILSWTFYGALLTDLPRVQRCIHIPASACKRPAWCFMSGGAAW